MKKPYIVTTHNSLEEIKILEEKILEIGDPLMFLSDIRINGSWANDIPHFYFDKQHEFGIVDDSLITAIETAMVDFGYIITITDVTTDLLHGKVDLTNADDETKNKINDFYFDLFDKNDVLDKISKLGIESLTITDKQILN